MMKMLKEREEIVKYGKKLITSGLTRGSGGNLSIINKEEGLIAISPSGLDYFETKAEDIVIVNLNGDIVQGNLKPSSELSMHLSLYRNREDACAIVHTHSKYASAISCMGWDLEPVHYLIALGGTRIKCSKYATYGSIDLANNVLDAIEGRKAALIGNHGLVALSSDLESAFSIADHLEFVSELFCISKSLGSANILTDSQLKEVMEKFNTHKYK